MQNHPNMGKTIIPSSFICNKTPAYMVPHKDFEKYDYGILRLSKYKYTTELIYLYHMDCAMKDGMRKMSQTNDLFKPEMLMLDTTLINCRRGA